VDLIAKNEINLTSTGEYNIPDVITLKSGINIRSNDYNLNLRGQRVNVIANDTSINLQAENGINISSQFEPINIYTASTNLRNNISLRAGGYISLTGENFIVNTAKKPVSPSSQGTSGEIAFDDNYFYRHNGINWTRTAMSTW
jgi:uncharacterized protein (DUF2345 family)